MTVGEAVDRIQAVFAHAWMVRNFLKHAEEIEDNEEMLEVHRTIFDCIRAVEPSFERGDFAEYLRRAEGKLGKLRKASETLSQRYREFSTHTNFEMAAASLAACARQLGEILDAARQAKAASKSTSPPAIP